MTELRPDLNDLRLLKLAELYEVAYERFILQVARRVVGDARVRAKLDLLTSPTDDHHERIVKEQERILGRLSPRDHAGIVLAALRNVQALEEHACDLYDSAADEAHDPRVRTLFRTLAREEAIHAAIAREALELAQKAPPPGADDAADAAFLSFSLYEEAEFPGRPSPPAPPDERTGPREEAKEEKE